MSARKLAERIGVPANRVTAIIKGTRSVTADTAVRLAEAFGTSAEFWLNLQTAHDLSKARDTFSDKIAPIVREEPLTPVHAAELFPATAKGTRIPATGRLSLGTKISKGDAKTTRKVKAKG